MRKLASIQKVTKVSPIQNADNIEVCTILGWQVVSKKDELKVGDMVIYCEIDSVMPDISCFDFLKKMTNDTMRIRTVRLRGQVSQGICFPLSFIEGFGLLPEDMTEGDDVTNAMQITKYEDELPFELLGKAKGYIPSDIPKSDILRVQTMQDVLDKYKGTLCYETEKIDGESITFYLRQNVFGVCSKIVDFIESEDSLHWNMAKQLDIKSKFHNLYDESDKLNFNISMQGEIIGEGIKGNKYKIKGKKVLFYNAFDIDKHRYFNYDEFVSLTNDLGLERVPLISDKFVLTNNIEDLVNESNGRSMLYDTKREGIVIIPLNEINDIIGRVMLKVISPEFLIKHGE